MSIQVKRRREAASFLSTFVGAVAELIVDTTNNRVQVHDGVTAGGWPAAKLAEVVTNTRTAVADANYTALATDRTVAFTALTAARTVTLPASSSYPTGTRLSVFDESGSCSATNTIAVAAAGTDLIDGAASAVISSAYGYLALQSSGAGKWTVVDQAASNLAAVGIGTAIDPSNPLSVYGANALFNSGSDIRVKLNKAAAANTASFAFQDGFSGRAEIGLTGDDNFHFKVSPDGSTWHDAFDIVDSSGLLNINNGVALVGGDLMIGNNTPTAPLTITTQTAALPALFDSGINVHVIAPNGGNSGLQFNSYANAGAVFMARAEGSLGSEAANPGNTVIGAFCFRGYDGTAYSGNAAVMRAATVGNWSTTNHGMCYQFLSTAQNSTSNAVAMSIYAGVVIGSGATDPGAGNLTVGGAMEVGAPTGGVLGAGTINVAGGIYLNNTAYTNPDFVFEKYFTGRIEKYADKPRALAYRGLMALDDLAVHVRETLRLPGIDDRSMDIFERGDVALEKLEEHALYILQLHRRVAALEARKS